MREPIGPPTKESVIDRRSAVKGRFLRGLLAVGVVAALLAPAGPAPGDTPTPGPNLTGRQLAGAWLAREARDGTMPGPGGRTDWGLTVDTLLALYATGVGESAARRIEGSLESHAGMYLGPDLYRDPDVRLGGSAAALLTAAVVTGNDPSSFGHGRYARAGHAYDIRAEVLHLIAGPHTGQPGRIRDRGTGNDSTNTFSQALAVVGLARSGGGQDAALRFLLSQQCRGGYFRMFYNDGKTCDQAHGAPDIDGTAIATEALVTARVHGSRGLRGPIARARRWLERVQRPDGSFGGVGSSEPPNANSTGLAARALHSTGARTAYRQARRWVARLQIRPRPAAGAMAGEVGAIAYNPAALAHGRDEGVGTTQRDQWRRATAQAAFALAPTSLARIGSSAPEGNPRVPEVRPGRADDPPRDDDAPPEQSPDDQTPDGDDRSPDAGRPDDDPDGDRPGGTGPRHDATKGHGAAGSPSARLGGFIAASLVDGTHIEVRQGGESYVDYDRTADAVIALRILGEHPEAARSATDFLVRGDSVDAYAHGVPYEKGGAVYAEPLAKLSLIAQWLPGGGGSRVATGFADRLTALQNADGGFDDRGEQADRSMSTERQSWATLALRAAGKDAQADEARDALLAVQCGDGGFATDLTRRGCASGDPAATGFAVQAVNAAPDGAAVAGAYTDAAAASESTPPTAGDALVRAARYLSEQGAATDAVSASTGATTDWAGIAAVASGKQALGLDATYLAGRVADRLDRDGGVGATAHGRPSDVGASIQVAPAVAGRSLLSAPGSPLQTATRVSAGPEQVQRSAPAPAGDGDVLPPWVLYGLAALLALVLVLAAILLALRIVRPRTESRT